MHTVSSNAPIALVGFDGFVDTIVHLVRERFSDGSWARIETIEEFSQRIADASGKSANIECVDALSLLGGNAPLFSQAAATLGINIELIACLAEQHGSSSFHSVFLPLVEHERIHATLLHQAGLTDAYEFHNGKVLFGKMRGINTLRLSSLLAVLPEQKLLQKIERSSAVVTVNWTMMPLVDDFWCWLVKKTEEKTLNPDKKMLFVDFSDPRKRGRVELARAYSSLRACAKVGFSVVLSVNMSEALQSLQAFFGEEIEVHGILEAAQKLHAAFPEATAIIGHAHREVAASWQDGEEMLTVPYVEKPYATTGAGDTFNGAVVAALLQGKSYLEALKWGVAASGVWVRQRQVPAKIDGA